MIHILFLRFRTGTEGGSLLDNGGIFLVLHGVGRGDHGFVICQSGIVFFHSSVREGAPDQGGGAVVFRQVLLCQRFVARLDRVIRSADGDGFDKCRIFLIGCPGRQILAELRFQQRFEDGSPVQERGLFVVIRIAAGIGDLKGHTVNRGGIGGKIVGVRHTVHAIRHLRIATAEDQDRIGIGRAFQIQPRLEFSGIDFIGRGLVSGKIDRFMNVVPDGGRVHVQCDEELLFFVESLKRLDLGVDRGISQRIIPVVIVGCPVLALIARFHAVKVNERDHIQRVFFAELFPGGRVTQGFGDESFQHITGDGFAGMMAGSDEDIFRSAANDQHGGIHTLAGLGKDRAFHVRNCFILLIKGLKALLLIGDALSEPDFFPGFGEGPFKVVPVVRFVAEMGLCLAQPLPGFSAIGTDCRALRTDLALPFGEAEMDRAGLGGDGIKIPVEPVQSVIPQIGGDLRAAGLDPDDLHIAAGVVTGESHKSVSGSEQCARRQQKTCQKQFRFLHKFRVPLV